MTISEQLDRMTDIAIAEWAEPSAALLACNPGFGPPGGRVPGYYDCDEREHLLTLVRDVSAGGRIVEIGVQFGRSASIYFLEALRRSIVSPDDLALDIHLVDNWCVDGADAQRYLYTMIGAIRAMTDPPAVLDYTPHWMGSAEAAVAVAGPIDLLHIDGDHGTPGVWDDCRLWLPKVRVGGVAVFHDYNRHGADGTGDVFPEVTAAVTYNCFDLVASGIGTDPVLTTIWSRRREQFGDPIGRWKWLGVVNTQAAARRIR